MRGRVERAAAAAGMDARGSARGGGGDTWRAGLQPGPPAAEIAGSLADCISRKSEEAVFPPDRPPPDGRVSPSAGGRPSAGSSHPHRLLRGCPRFRHVCTCCPSVTACECRDAEESEEAILTATPCLAGCLPASLPAAPGVTFPHVLLGIVQWIPITKSQNILNLLSNGKNMCLVFKCFQSSFLPLFHVYSLSSDATIWLWKKNPESFECIELFLI